MSRDNHMYHQLQQERNENKKLKEKLKALEKESTPIFTQLTMLGDKVDKDSYVTFLEETIQTLEHKLIEKEEIKNFDKLSVNLTSSLMKIGPPTSWTVPPNNIIYPGYLNEE